MTSGRVRSCAPSGPIPRPTPSPDSPVSLRTAAWPAALALAVLALTLPSLAETPVAPAAAPAAAAGTPLGPAGPTTQLAPTALRVALPYDDALLAALGKRDWAAAVPLLQKVDRTKLPGAVAADHLFVLAWALERAGRESEAVGLVEPVRAAVNAPADYASLVVGEILLAQGRPVDAIPVLSAVASDSPILVRAKLALAQAYEAAGRTADARAVYEALVARPDPAPGSNIALAALARRSDADKAKQYKLRLYRHYPNSAEDRAMAADSPPTPGIADIAARGDRLQEDGSYAAAVGLLDPQLANVSVKDCVYRYAWGRAQHKLNNITAAAAVLEPLGSACRGVDDERGAKALYLAGKAYERKKEWASAARAYARIPEWYPKHSMADDGYALGGIALQQAGDLPGARKLWEAGFERYPQGDLAAENAWRLAYGAALAGDTPGAIRWADRAVYELPVQSNPTDVLASAYWAARWRAWPSMTESKARNPDAAQVALATDQFEQIAREAPWHYYGWLAHARLVELAPERAKAITRPAMDADDAPWQVSEAWRATPAVDRALGLARVGLLAEALVELDTLDDASFGGSEMAIATHLQDRAGRFLEAHDRLRTWIRTHPPATLGPNAYKVMRQAYPERWWAEVQAAATYSWDARVFHALVREESNFNQKIESHAGARGLSQLMPATASGVAKRMGLSYSSSKIWEPETNLKIGAYYLDMLHTRYHGNSALALAGYNAGEGNADKWLAPNPDVATDAYVEAIPFRETRHYVKRVLSTWQTYRLLYGREALYTDGARFNHDAVP